MWSFRKSLIRGIGFVGFLVFVFAAVFFRKADAALFVSNIQIDSAFGSGGVAVIPTKLQAGVQQILPQPDGSLFVGGLEGMQPALVLAHVTPSGQPDVTFGSSGVLTQTILGMDQAYQIQVQPDGKWLVMGYRNFPTPEDFYLRRYLSDGTHDPDFGVDGLVVTGLPVGANTPKVLAIQTDQNILAAGVINGDSGIVRYLPNGSLDTTFSTNGWAQVSVADSYEEINALFVQPDKKILAVGNAAVISTGRWNIFLMRLLENGELDTTFGQNGFELYDDYGSAKPMPYFVVQLADERILVGGMEISNSFPPHQTPILRRFSNNGAADASFCISCSFPVNYFTKMLVQPSGSMLVLGSSGGKPVFLQLNPEGDVSQIIDSRDKTGFSSLVNDLQGRFIVGGSESSGYPIINFQLMRYLPPPFQQFLPILQR